MSGWQIWLWRRQAGESQLRPSVANEQLNSLLNAATRVSIVATDLSGNIVTFNRGSELMLGYKASEMIGRNTPAAMHLASEVAARSVELTAAYGRSIVGFEVFVHSARLGQPEEREWTYVHRDGSELSVKLIVTAIHDNEGLLAGFLGIATDNSEHALRRAANDALNSQHELLSKLSDCVPGMIFQGRRFMDGRSVLHYTSGAIRDIYELDPQQAAGDMTTVLSRADPQDLGRVVATLDEAIAQGNLFSTWKESRRENCTSTSCGSGSCH